MRLVQQGFHVWLRHHRGHQTDDRDAAKRVQVSHDVADTLSRHSREETYFS